METTGLAVIAVVILAVGLVSQRLTRSIITPPMLFVMAGYLVGPDGLGLIAPIIDGSVAEVAVEVTLIMVLFTDGASMRICDDVSRYTLVLRLLAIGMLVSVAIGTLVGAVCFPDLGFWQAALLAAVLTPTDSALGQVAVSHPRIPLRIRQNLHLESGLNDGLIVPVILFLTVCDSLAAGRDHLTFWVTYLASQIGLGVAAGIGIGYLGGWMVRFTTQTHYMSRIFEQLSAIALALLAYSISESVGGNGLVSAFVAGITFGRSFHHLSADIHEFAEAQSQLLTLITFLLFGAVIAGPALQQATPSTFVYALLSLSVIRIVAVAVSLIGSGVGWETKLFLGWMGPRGIASLLFGLVVLETLNITQREEIFTVVVATVLLSIFLHGISAMPFSKWYSQRCESNDAGEGPTEDPDKLDREPLI